MDVKASWEKFLNPQILRGNLFDIAVFVCVFEMFNDALIDKPKTFFSEGSCRDDHNGGFKYILGEAYEENVKARHKYPDEASLLWFKEMGAVNDEDIAKYHEIRKFRNEIAHEMIHFISSSTRVFRPDLFDKMVELYNKIEKWWFINFEAAIDPEAIPEGTDPNEVIPGSMMTIRLILEIATGNEPEEGYYYKEFLKRFNPSKD